MRRAVGEAIGPNRSTDWGPPAVETVMLPSPALVSGTGNGACEAADQHAPRSDVAYPALFDRPPGVLGSFPAQPSVAASAAVRQAA